jgi:Tfp pilus assembly protein FimV
MRAAVASFALLLIAVAAIVPVCVAIGGCVPHGCCAAGGAQVVATATDCCPPALCADQSQREAVRLVEPLSVTASAPMPLVTIADLPVLRDHATAAEAPPAPTRLRLARLATLLI